MLKGGKKMKKAFILIFLISILSGCSKTLKEYSFDDRPISYTTNKDYEKYIYIYIWWYHGQI